MTWVCPYCTLHVVCGMSLGDVVDWVSLSMRALVVCRCQLLTGPQRRGSPEFHFRGGGGGLTQLTCRGSKDWHECRRLPGYQIVKTGPVWD